VHDSGVASYTIFTTVTAVNDAPTAMITYPLNNTESGSFRRVEGYGIDVDLPYGDNLSYIWSSDYNGYIGSGPVVENVVLDAGVHKITLTVKDRAGAESSTYVVVLVDKQETGDRVDSIGGTGSLRGSSALVGILVIVMILIIAFAIIVKFTPLFPVLFPKKSADIPQVSRPPPSLKPSEGANLPIRYRTVDEVTNGAPIQPQVAPVVAQQPPVAQDIVKPKKGPEIVDAELVEWPVDDSNN